MNRNYLYILTMGLLLNSCGLESFFMPPSADTGDTAASDEHKVMIDTATKDVFAGKGSVYPYQPDTLFNELVIGSDSSFAAFVKLNGATIHPVNDSIAVTLYMSKNNEEWMQVWLFRDRPEHYFPFSIVVQKRDDLPVPLYGERPMTTGHFSFTTGHGIYIGMSQSYVMNVYTDQHFIRTVKGDTLTLHYQPQKKDAEYYRRYSFGKVYVNYKFVYDHLRRIEYHIDPSEFHRKK